MKDHRQSRRLERRAERASRQGPLAMRPPKKQQQHGWEVARPSQLCMLEVRACLSNSEGQTSFLATGRKKGLTVGRACSIPPSAYIHAHTM